MSAISRRKTKAKAKAASMIMAGIARTAKTNSVRQTRIRHHGLSGLCRSRTSRLLECRRATSCRSS